MAERQIVIYEPTPDFRMQVKTDGETVWLSQAQMAELFGRDQSVITRHISNIFKEGELERDSVYAKFAYTAADGKTAVESEVKQIKSGMAYLVKQLTTEPKAPPRRKIGFHP